MWGAPRDPSAFAGDTVTVKSGFWSLGKRLYARHHALEARYYSRGSANCVRLGVSRASLLLTEHHAGPCFMAFGLRVDPKAESTASFVYAGELLQKFPVKLPLAGVDFAISAHGLKLDLSGEQLLQDAAFEKRWVKAKSRFLNVYDALTAIYGKSPVKGVLFEPERFRLTEPASHPD
jgi:hypothetical protein